MARNLATFRRPSNSRAAFELAVSALPLILLWLLMWLSLEIHYAVTLLLAVPAAGFLLRLFLIQHDCGHGSFFKGRRANDWAGRCIGVLTLSPMSCGAGDMRPTMPELATLIAAEQATSTRLLSANTRISAVGLAYATACTGTLR